MNNDLMQANDIWLIQPNKVTESKRNYTALEEDILTLLMHMLQPLMSSKEKTPDLANYNTDLFGNLILTINLSSIKNNNFRKSDYYKAALGLMGKKFSFDWTHPNGLKAKTAGVIIHTVTTWHNRPIIDLYLNQWAIPFFTYWGKNEKNKGGYTSFHKGVALILQGNHTKRIYKMLKQWQNNRGEDGVFEIDISTFKEQLGIENSYKLNSDLIRSVLEPAKERMKDKGDIYFNFELDNVGESRAKNLIRFFIHPNNQNRKSINKSDMYALCYMVVGWCYPAMSENPQRICDTISENPDNFYRFYTRLKKEKERYMSGEDLRNIIPLVKTILKEDYQIK